MVRALASSSLRSVAPPPRCDLFSPRRHRTVVSRETGKPRVEAILAEVLLALDTTDFLARQAPGLASTRARSASQSRLRAKSGWTEFHPHGVVAIISPWNYPFAIPIAQIVPALVAGNAVLLKPSELTPGTGALIAELIEQAKFPRDLVQVLQGRGRPRRSHHRSRSRQSLFHRQRGHRSSHRRSRADEN